MVIFNKKLNHHLYLQAVRKLLKFTNSVISSPLRRIELCGIAPEILSKN